MSVTLETQKNQVANLVLSGISWSQFEAIEAAFSDIPGVRFIYLDGLLEIMTISAEYEDFKGTIRALVEAYMREQGIRFYIRGSATLGGEAIGARKEPDESYNLETKKLIPDLVIEVILSSGGISILQVYQRIGVPEVWLWEDGTLGVYHLLKEQTGYKQLEQSQLLPNLNLSMMAKYITYYDQYDAVTEFLQELRQ